MIVEAFKGINYPVGYFLIWQPSINKEHKLQLYPPLSHFDHWVIKLKITILAPTPFYILGSNYWIQLFVVIYIKAPFGTQIYLYLLQISRV